MTVRKTAAQRRNEAELRERDLKLIQTDLQLAVFKELPVDGSEAELCGEKIALLNADEATWERYRAITTLEARGLARRSWLRYAWSLTTAGKRLRDGKLPAALPALSRDEAMALIAELPYFDPGDTYRSDGDRDDYDAGHRAGYETGVEDCRVWIREVLARVAA